MSVYLSLILLDLRSRVVSGSSLCPRSSTGLGTRGYSASEGNAFSCACPASHLLSCLSYQRKVEVTEEERGLTLWLCIFSRQDTALVDCFIYFLSVHAGSRGLVTNDFITAPNLEKLKPCSTSREDARSQEDAKTANTILAGMNLNPQIWGYRKLYCTFCNLT